jgi:sugar phosphate permease
MTAVLAAGVIGGPISGALLRLDGAAGLAGWQWLFLIEGIPAVILGVVVLFVLEETPAEVNWLTASERHALLASLDAGPDADAHKLGRFLRDPRIWLLAAVYFTIPLVSYGIQFWLPQMLKNASHADDFTVGVLTAIPYAAGAIAMVIVGRRSDRLRERRFHVLVPAVASAAGLVLSTFGTTTAWIVVTLSIAVAGYASMFGPFWALATASMRGVGAAAAIALINSLGNTGGFVGPYLLGAINDRTHSFAIGFYVIAAVLIGGAALVLVRGDGGNGRNGEKQ